MDQSWVNSLNRALIALILIYFIQKFVAVNRIMYGFLISLTEVADLFLAQARKLQTLFRR